ncbi:MAG: HepT-like ribonuclease domain-containing protein, partial [Terracidiphilus sp.]
MNKHEFRSKDYLLHMLEAIDRILQYTAGVNEEGFSASQMLQDAVVRNIEIIGEAAKNLLEAGPDFAGRYPSIPFAQIYGMRSYASRLLWFSGKCKRRSNVEEQEQRQTISQAQPELLYHYTTQEGLLGILKSRSIWASHIRFLNDTSEGKIFLGAFTEILEEMRKNNQKSK